MGGEDDGDQDEAGSQRGRAKKSTHATGGRRR